MARGKAKRPSRPARKVRPAGDKKSAAAGKASVRRQARQGKAKAARVARKAVTRKAAARKKTVKALVRAAKARPKKSARKTASPVAKIAQRVAGSLKRAVIKTGIAPAAPTPAVASGGDDGLQVLQDLISLARKAGADSADALFVRGVQVAVGQRLGQREKLERSEGHDIGLRVLIGKRQAMVSTTDFAPATLGEVARRAVAMARAVPEDPYCGIAPAELLARTVPVLDLDEGREPQTRSLIEKCARAEEAALAVPGITNSEGAEAGWSRTEVTLATSNGFAGHYVRSGHSLSVAVLAGQDTAMERDYEWTSAVYERDMMAPETVGKRAADRAVRRLNPRVARSARVPVVYDRRVAGGLLGHLTSAINGRAIARGTSFLKDHLGKKLFAPGIQVIDDAHRPRGLRSKPFDGEGLPTRRTAVIDDGMLTTWLLDLASAWQLKLAPTGHAARGTSGPPSPAPSNLYLMPSEHSPEALIADIASGLYVTELIGFGVNGVTGDYSRGAAGFWIENGKLGYPVSGVTVAGNLKQIFANLQPANDLEFKSGMDSPTVRVEGMTVAGQ